MKHFGLILPFLLLFSSCYNYDENRIPSSSGATDEVMMIIADEYYKSELSDTISYYLTGYFPVLPKYSPLLKLKIRSYSQFKQAGDALNRYRHLIFLGMLNEQNPVSRLIKRRLGEELTKKALTDSTFYLAVQKNVYAKPQKVYYLFAPDSAALVNRVAEYHEHIQKQITGYELKRLSQRLYGQDFDREINQKLHEKFDISLKVPEYFFIIEEDEDLLWIGVNRTYKNEKNAVVRQVRQHMFIQEIPFSDSIREFIDAPMPFLDSLEIIPYPIALRDTLGKKYVKGAADSFYMYTDILRAPLYQHESELEGRYVIETRGMWGMDNPFQGGSFINFTFYDKPNDRLLVFDGYTLAPGSTANEKRKMIRSFEAMMQWLRFGKVNYNE